MQQIVGPPVHSAEDVSEYVAEALRICSAYDLEPPTESRLLPVLVQLLAHRGVAMAQPQSFNLAGLDVPAHVRSAS